MRQRRHTLGEPTKFVNQNEGRWVGEQRREEMEVEKRSEERGEEERS
jgi:hypothetical protein